MATISVIVPVYFNAQSLPALIERLGHVAAAEVTHSFEFVFVDDGSGDDSYQVLQALAVQDRRIRLVQLSRNFGSNLAILAGLTFSQGDCAAFIAADLQDPPEALHDMIRHWEAGAEVVLAIRQSRAGDPWLTRVFAYVFNQLFKRLVFNEISPQGVGFALVDRKVTRVLVECSEKNAHLIGLILWSGFRRAVIYYDRVARKHGRSRWTFAKKVDYFIDTFVAFSRLPLRISSTLGFVMATLGGLYALVIAFLRITGGIPVQGWTAVMCVILVTSGTQLVMLGITGEYLWRNFDATRRRPAFIVSDLTNVQVPPPQLDFIQSSPSG